jgi:hypothetical protein
VLFRDAAHCVLEHDACNDARLLSFVSEIL